jgi:hypothetical protein
VSGRVDTTGVLRPLFSVAVVVGMLLAPAASAAAVTASPASPYVKVQPGTRPPVFNPSLAVPKGGAAMF